MANQNQTYCKIPKISPGAYMFQRPFLRGLFLEGLIFGGAYLWREICVSKSIGLALQLKGNLPFHALFYYRYIFEGSFQVQAPGGAYIWRSDLTDGFLRYKFGGGGLYLEGLIHGEAYFQNFTVLGYYCYCVNPQRSVIT